jgi:hypothetical protein
MSWPPAGYRAHPSDTFSDPPDPPASTPVAAPIDVLPSILFSPSFRSVFLAYGFEVDLWSSFWIITGYVSKANSIPSIATYYFGKQIRFRSKRFPKQKTMGVWQGVAMDSLKYHRGPPDPSTSCGRATTETAYSHFMGGPPAGRAACGCLLPVWTPHAMYACAKDFTSYEFTCFSFRFFWHRSR